MALGLLATLAAACSAPAPPPPSTTPAVPGPAAPSAAGCAADVAPAPLPGWARGGFSPPDQAVPFVVGERGTILGVLFGQPFSAPAAPDRGNKILWVTRDPHPDGPLTITAALGDATTAVPARSPTGPARRWWTCPHRAAGTSPSPGRGTPTG